MTAPVRSVQPFHPWFRWGIAGSTRFVWLLAVSACLPSDTVGHGYSECHGKGWELELVSWDQLPSSEPPSALVDLADPAWTESSEPEAYGLPYEGMFQGDGDGQGTHRIRYARVDDDQ